MQTATKDKDKDVRQAAVKALRKIGAQLQGQEREEVLKAWQEATKDKCYEVRVEAIKKRCQNNPEHPKSLTSEDLETLEEAVEGQEEKAKRSAINVLGEFGTKDNPKILTLLRVATDGPDGSICAAAVEALAKLGDDSTPTLDLLERLINFSFGSLQDAAKKAFDKLRTQPFAS